MKPVKQKDKNDCLSACVASLTHHPIEKFPITFGDKRKFGKFLKVLDSIGYSLEFGLRPSRPDCLYIACIPQYDPGETGSFHAVIGREGKVVWDPTTSKTKLRRGMNLYRVDSYIWLRKTKVRKSRKKNTDE